MSKSLPYALAATLVGVLAPPQPARALDPDRPLDACTVEVWGARNGLPSSFVRAISQTPDGYLWIAGYGGVGRYDGARIVSLPQPKALARIFDTLNFKLDHQGTLWLISSKGTPVCVRDLRGARLLARRRPVARGRTPGGRPPRSRWQRLAGDAHQGCCATCLVPRLAWCRWPRPSSGARCSSTAIAPAGCGWGVRRGLFRADKDGAGNSGVVPPASDGKGPISDPVRAYFETPQGRLWFLYDRGLLRVEGDQVRMLPDGQAADYGRGNQVIEDRDGNVWIGTRSGLTRFRDGQWVSYTTRDGLPDNDATALFEDREGSLWVGTRSGGIAQFTDRVVTANAGPPSLRDNQWIGSLSQDRTGAYWFGSRSGLVRWRADGRDGHEQLFTTRDGLPDNEVLAVVPGAANEVWVGTARGFARVTGDKVEVPQTVGGAIPALHVDGSGALWMGSGTKLLRFYQGRLEEFGQSTQGPVRNIESDSSGQIWVAANLGVSRLRDHRLVPVMLSEDDHPGRALHRDREGRVWATRRNRHRPAQPWTGPAAGTQRESWRPAAVPDGRRRSRASLDRHQPGTAAFVQGTAGGPGRRTARRHRSAVAGIR